MYKPYKWEFNEEVAQCFDEHVRQSVFMYDEFHKSIIKMSNWFIEDNTNVLDYCIKEIKNMGYEFASLDEFER